MKTLTIFVLIVISFWFLFLLLNYYSINSLSNVLHDWSTVQLSESVQHPYAHLSVVQDFDKLFHTLIKDEETKKKYERYAAAREAENDEMVELMRRVRQGEQLPDDV